MPTEPNIATFKVINQDLLKVDQFDKTNFICWYQLDVLTYYYEDIVYFGPESVTISITEL